MRSPRCRRPRRPPSSASCHHATRFVNGDGRLVVPDPANARQVRRATGGPGTILIDAELIGTRPHRRAGRGLQVELQPFTRLPKDRHRELEEQARAVGRARGADDFDLTVVDAS